MPPVYRLFLGRPGPLGGDAREETTQTSPRDTGLYFCSTERDAERETVTPIAAATAAAEIVQRPELTPAEVARSISRYTSLTCIFRKENKPR